MINILEIIKYIIIILISFISGAVWLQTKETKYGIKAKFECENCEAIGCQAKFCKERKKVNDK